MNISPVCTVFQDFYSFESIIIVNNNFKRLYTIRFNYILSSLSKNV